MTKSDERTESLAKAIEDHMIGIAALSHNQKAGATPSQSVREYVEKGRQQLREKLAEFLVPAMRVIEGGAQRAADAECPVCLGGPGLECWKRQDQLANCPSPQPPKEVVAMGIMSTWTPEPHWPSDEQLLERAVSNAGRRCLCTHFRWFHVRGDLGVGSTLAQALCRRFGLDPDEKV